MIDRRTLLFGTASPLLAAIPLTNADEAKAVKMLPAAQKLARPPISNFRVGAIALGTSGTLYPGANIEIPGNPLNQTVHAEQAAIANAYAKRERGIKAIAVTDAPCGHCRQFLNEIEGGERIRVLIPNQRTRTIADLLPSSASHRGC